LFLDDGEASVEAGRALAEEPEVVRLLQHTPYVLVRCGKEDLDVAKALFTKYSGEPLGKVPAAVQLDADGQWVATADVAAKGPLESWLAAWMSPRETPGPLPPP
jgi:hypothetical protein